MVDGCLTEEKEIVDDKQLNKFARTADQSVEQY